MGISLWNANVSTQWTDFYFLKNLQGDVLKVYRSDGVLAASYSYDSWGNIVDISGSVTFDDKGVANLNPFRYRSYYYDSETWFYYLQSRYYDPLIGRFINADVLASTGQGILGCNMFAYCNNNPVCYMDPNGMSACLADSSGNKDDEDTEKQNPFATLRNKILNIWRRLQVGGALTKDDYMGGEEQNCGGFVLGEDEQIWPGKKSKMPQWNNIFSVALAFMRTCKEYGRSCRFLLGPYSFVGGNEYRVTLRISTTPSGSRVYGQDYHDYHFMVLASDGLWYERKGQGGDLESHTFSDFLNMPYWEAEDGTKYDSIIIYFAIGAK